jgi:hypothetical protein
MLSTWRNVYPDSDFFPDAFQLQQAIALDLTQLKIYRVNGEAMIKLADLQTLNILIAGNEGEVIEFPKAA